MRTILGYTLSSKAAPFLGTKLRLDNAVMPENSGLLPLISSLNRYSLNSPYENSGLAAVLLQEFGLRCRVRLAGVRKIVVHLKRPQRQRQSLFLLQPAIVPHVLQALNLSSRRGHWINLSQVQGENLLRLSNPHYQLARLRIRRNEDVDLAIAIRLAVENLA